MTWRWDWGKVWKNIKWKDTAVERPELKLESYVVLSVFTFHMIISFPPVSLKNPFTYK